MTRTILAIFFLFFVVLAAIIAPDAGNIADFRAPKIQGPKSVITGFNAE